MWVLFLCGFLFPQTSPAWLQLNTLPKSSCLVLMLVSLTWERHFAICYPHQYRIRIRTIPLWRHLAQYIVPVVVLSFVLNIPTFINTYKVCKSNQPWYLRNSNKNSSSLAVGSVKDNSTGEHNVGKAALS